MSMSAGLDGVGLLVGLLVGALERAYNADSCS